MQTCQVIQISDPHLPAAGQAPVHGQRIDPWDKLANLIQDVRKLINPPDLIVFSGDLINDGQVADYQRFRRMTTALAEEFHCPVHAIIGDCDQRQAFYQGYLVSDPGPSFCERLRLKNMDFYFLDSKLENGGQAGLIGSEQLQWLGKHLRQAPTKRVFIFIHHPLAGPGLENLHNLILQNTDTLLSVLRGHNIGGIFSGHLHFGSSYLNGANFLNVVAGSASYAVDYTDPQQPLFQEACGYQIIQINRGQVGVTSRQLFLDRTIIDSTAVPGVHFLDNELINR